MKAQPAHAEAMPVPQRVGRNSRIGDGDAAQAAAVARQRVQHDAVVVAVRIALHDDAVCKTEMIEQREVFFGRRRRRRVAAARRERKCSAGPNTWAWVSQAPGGGGSAGRRGFATAGDRDVSRAGDDDAAGSGRLDPSASSARAPRCRDRAAHPSLIFASRTTWPQFSISAATKARNSSGVFSRNSTLSALQALDHLGLPQRCVQAGIELARRSPARCPWGRTPRSIHRPRSPASVSATAGRSGSVPSRPRPVCAMALSAPPCT